MLELDVGAEPPTVGVHVPGEPEPGPAPPAGQLDGHGRGVVSVRRGPVFRHHDGGRFSGDLDTVRVVDGPPAEQPVTAVEPAVSPAAVLAAGPTVRLGPEVPLDEPASAELIIPRGDVHPDLAGLVVTDPFLEALEQTVHGEPHGPDPAGVHVELCLPLGPLVARSPAEPVAARRLDPDRQVVAEVVVRAVHATEVAAGEVPAPGPVLGVAG